ncbi:insulin-degrading enzyme-like [Tubulanus polymorphus]|uniref:insulin-degrading enzyme-like n=1 Tax=Tubulanus polymorphus TaxID=672921 RepID=UPI003DA5B6A6
MFSVMKLVSFRQIVTKIYSKNIIRSHFIATGVRFCSQQRLEMAPSSADSNSTVISKSVESIIKPQNDKRGYRGLELSNGMKVLLISDPETDKSSAAMDVHIGHMMDPFDLPGLAHFCEHMLFLGTEKYPGENDYTKFLSENGGSSNAFTSAESTNFYFDVAPDQLANALDRFSQFFLNPLFTSSATEREVNAVDSENSKNIPSDGWRFNQLEKSTADPNHDFSKFGTGNKETLETIPKQKGLDVRDELLKFHDKYYSSNLMALCVLGKESLDELTDLVVKLFADVKNKNVKVPEWLEHPYGPDQCKLKASVVPIKDVRNMNITWPIPDVHPHYKSGPDMYLGHLLGHEGPGSMLSELKLRGWVNTIVAGQKTGAKGFMFFVLNADLTEEGINHVDDIVSLTFQYLNLLRKEGTQEWVFEECRDLNAMTFRFKDKDKPRSYTCGLAAALHDYPIEEVISGPYLLYDFKPELIDMVLDKLTPENIRVAVIGKKFEGQTDLKEKWYGTDYKLEPIPQELLDGWSNAGLHPNLALPERNEFIPSNFDIVEREKDVNGMPIVVRQTSLSRLWFKQDDKFLLPKSCITMELTSPMTFMDPISVNLSFMFTQLFKDALNEYTYQATLAGLHYSLDTTAYGILLSVRGYNDKQIILLKKILEKLTSFEIDSKRFQIIKETYSRALKNFKAEQPYQHALYYTTVVLMEQIWTKEELLDALDDMNVERLKAFIPLYLSRLFIEGLIYGNVTKEKALELQDVVEGTLKRCSNTRPLLPSQRRRYREVEIPYGGSYLYECKNDVHKSSGLELYYQYDVQNTKTNTMLELFCQLINESTFDVLRTQEQLGYIVMSGIRRTNGVQGLRVLVQSDRHPDYVDQRVEAYLLYIESFLENMTDEVFKRHVSALETKILEKPKKISQQNSKYWAEISCQQYNFERDTVEVAQIKTLTKDDIVKFYKEFIAPNAPKRRKLALYVKSGANGDTSQEKTETNGVELNPVPTIKEPILIEDVPAFKRTHALFPLPKPFIDLSMKAKL